jgi:hypothetical protein
MHSDYPVADGGIPVSIAGSPSSRKRYYLTDWLDLHRLTARQCENALSALALLARLPAHLPALHPLALAAWRAANRHYLSRDGATLARALRDRASPYHYSRNYPIARVLASECLAQLPAAALGRSSRTGSGSPASRPSSVARGTAAPRAAEPAWPSQATWHDADEPASPEFAVGKSCPDDCLRRYCTCILLN